MVEIAYRKALASVQAGHQVMIFVHSRSDTARTAAAVAELARNDNCELYFSRCADNPGYDVIKQKVARCRNRELQDLFGHGFGIHHAGMLRSDRALVEKAFAEGFINVLVCTATLAWG
jgi:antiviral helicase SLH1